MGLTPTTVVAHMPAGDPHGVAHASSLTGELLELRILHDALLRPADGRLQCGRIKRLDDGCAMHVQIDFVLRLGSCDRYLCESVVCDECLQRAVQCLALACGEMLEEMRFVLVGECGELGNQGPALKRE